VNRPSGWTTWGTAALLGAFALSGAFRLNGFCLLEPDSPEYLFGARSLASLDGYREIDRPGEPVHTLRPPGLPVLLIPLSWIAPFSVVGAKLIVLAFALAAIVLAMRLAARDGPAWGAIAAGLAIATSPYSLLHATEIVSEFPYLAFSFAALLVMTRSADRPSRRDVIVAAFCLATLPFLRTIGLALVLAVVVWIALDRRRRAFWPAPAAAIAASGLWMVRNAVSGGPTYFGAIAADLHRLGPSAFAAKSAAAVGFYGARFLDVLLPGVRPGRPLYERMTVGGTPDLGGLYGVGVALGLAFVAAAAFGVWSRRRAEGALIALYVPAFLLVLAIYPPRHERLTWPLVPLAWASIPSGLSKLPRPVRAAALTLIAALALWQGAASLAMAKDNLAWARGGDRFYTERIPPIYFADWRAAGAWLREHAPPHVRVLTRHSDVGFTSGLLQESVRFEELPPQAWRARIAKLHARFLVVPASVFGKFFPFDLLASDPAYAYAVRWKQRDVAIVEVLPNRSGRVTAAATDASDATTACDRAAAEPRRVDLSTRCAELSAATGRRDAAIARLGALVDRGGADVRETIALGQLLLSAGRADDAAAAFRAASDLPEAELLDQVIERGRALAERRIAAKGLAAKQQVQAAVERGRAFMDALRWKEAGVEIDEALTLAPGDPSALRAAGDLATRLGEYDRATRLYEAAGALGDNRAAAQGAALVDALGVEASLATAAPLAIVRAAAYWAGEGSPGRALDLLERASVTLPGEREIEAPLGELRRFYGLD
jgi:tetratricopeptide (TPR) repeat protein